MAKLKRNAILVFGLALLFAWGFGFAKHNPMLRPIIPFGDDPYDAIGSFGVITALLLVFVSLARAFFPGLSGRSGSAIYVLRAQAAICFCVLVTVAADVAAMGRHVTMWIDAAGRAKLLIVLGTLVASSLAVLPFTRDSQTPRRRGLYAQAICAWLISLLILWIYPERIIAGAVGHLLTVVFGDLLLFVPVAMLLKAWLPSTLNTGNRRDQQSGHFSYRSLALAAAIGLLVGAVAFLGEMSEGGPSPHLSQLLFVAAVFLALGMAGLLVGYLCLGRLLGFVIDGPHPPESSSVTCSAP